MGVARGPGGRPRSSERRSQGVFPTEVAEVVQSREMCLLPPLRPPMMATVVKSNLDPDSTQRQKQCVPVTLPESGCHVLGRPARGRGAQPQLSQGDGAPRLRARRVHGVERRGGELCARGGLGATDRRVRGFCRVGAGAAGKVRLAQPPVERVQHAQQVGAAQALRERLSVGCVGVCVHNVQLLERMQSPPRHARL